MFFPVQSKDGKKALINLDLIFAFVSHGTSTVALSTGGSTFEIPATIEEIEQHLSELGDDDDE